MSFISAPGTAMVNTVTFPGLGLQFDLNRVAFLLFGRPVYWYGIIIGLGFLLAVTFCCRRVKTFGLRQDDIFDLLLAAVPLSLVGCRTYYVLFNLDRFRREDGTLDWGAVVRISDGGIAIYGAVIMAALTLLVFCRWRKLPFTAFADLGVQGLFVGQLVGRWGNFMNVEAYGGVTDAPWRMCSPAIARWLYGGGQIDEVTYQSILTGELGVHPTFLYESLWNVVGFALVVYLSKKFYKFDGQLFLTYVLWYGLGRFWIEGLRTDSLYFFGIKLFGYSIRTSQVLALVSAMAALGVLIWRFAQVKKKPELLYAQRLAQENNEEA
jgi:phosphatidylglycerol:prolipoprotein diacylglycerol transferase